MRASVRTNLPAAPKRRRNDMSKDALAKVVQRAISDAAFRRQLNSDPTGALRGFDLSTDELSALRTGDAGRLSTLGIDQRMSKAFAIGGALASTRMSQSDLTPGGGPALVDDMSGAGGRTGIPSDPTRPGGPGGPEGRSSGPRAAARSPRPPRPVPVARSTWTAAPAPQVRSVRATTGSSKVEWLPRVP